MDSFVSTVRRDGLGLQAQTSGFGEFKVPIVIAVVAIAVIISLFWATAESAVHIWRTSSAFTHGIMIIPVAVYLIWNEREEFLGLSATPSFMGVAVTGIFGMVWFAADLLGINEGRHIALVGMMQGVLLGVLGLAVYRKFIFAFSYLWLMVPAGEFLLSPLQNLAHAGAVGLLQLSGIPVFAEGILIQVPHGNFIVEAGCAGLNFLLSALALSLVYGKVMYRRWTTRVLCVAIALSVSIVTNIVRIYLIIALTEWTDKRIGLADDHLLFGWGVFCVVMLVLMWFGAKAEQPGLTANIQTESYHRRRQSPWSSWRGVGVAIGAVIAAACALPLSAAAELRQMPAAFYAGLDADVGPWQRAGITKSNWRPRLVPGDATFNAAYARAGSRPVEVVVVFYDTQHDGREASAAGNGPAENATWHVIDTSMHTLNTDESAVFVTLQSGAMLRSVVYWYEGAGCRTGSRLKAKICTAWQRLWGGASASAFVVLSTDQASDRASAESTLREFAQWLPPFVQPPHAPATGS